MSRIEILVLNKGAEIYTKYADIISALAFLNRVGRINNFSIVAHKGEKALFIEKIENPAELIKKLNDFQNNA